ncbi:hypothetical protein [Lentibacillus juripiscarius]|uniref:Secreted protein n=1 Tax=Lentibacillus juripiscarius TaxID=257446 RepID=A0ABW5V8Q4_9BACI
MRWLSIQMTVIMLVCLHPGFSTAAAKENSEAHNWVEYSTHVETVDAGSHEYTYWKNLIQRTRTCDISHKLKSVVYYCDTHDHTDVEIFHEETVHSEKHE